MLSVCGFEGISSVGDWSNGMIGVSKTFGGSSILSSPTTAAAKLLRIFFRGVAQLVACLNGVQEAVSSILATRTINPTISR